MNLKYFSIFHIPIISKGKDYYDGSYQSKHLEVLIKFEQLLYALVSYKRFRLLTMHG